MPNDDRAPTTRIQWGNYILGDLMASGGMAEIFHAEPVTGRFEGPIVLKQMLPALADLKDFVAMFIEEARISVPAARAPSFRGSRRDGSLRA